MNLLIHCLETMLSLWAAIMESKFLVSFNAINIKLSDTGIYLYFVVMLSANYLTLTLERDVVIVRCRYLLCGFKLSLMQDFQRIIIFLLSQWLDIAAILCLWSRHFTLKCFTLLKCR